ncbi:hypothetical protein GCM10027614_25360 [Micromonospora vulcania]
MPSLAVHELLQLHRRDAAESVEHRRSDIVRGSHAVTPLTRPRFETSDRRDTPLAVSWGVALDSDSIASAWAQAGNMCSIRYGRISGPCAVGKLSAGAKRAVPIGDRPYPGVFTAG